MQRVGRLQLLRLAAKRAVVATAPKSAARQIFSRGAPMQHATRYFSAAAKALPEGIDYEFSTIIEMQETACKLYAKNDAFGTRVGDKFTWISYEEVAKQIQLFRNVLVHHNIGRNDKVAIISNNRVEWAVAIYAINSLGAQFVPMYEAQLEKDWRYIVEDSGAKLLLVANERIREKVKDYIRQVGNVESVLCFDSGEEYLHSTKRWMQLVSQESPVPPVPLSPKDLSTIIYTSGTTGNPKGVELSHENICANLYGLKTLWRGELRNHRSLAFLPWAHVFGQTAELHSLFATGSAMGIVPHREMIVECIGMIKPTIILSVPMLFNKVYDAVHKKMSNESPLTQKVFKYAMEVSRRVNHAKEFHQAPGIVDSIMHKICDAIVFKKIRQNMGGNLRFMASGGAAVSLPVLQFFEDIGVPICEGYGLTETSPVITAGANNWDSRRLGCLGVPLCNVQVEIMDPSTMTPVPVGQEGEVCCSGPSVMVGYRNNVQANEEVFFMHQGSRFFRTGDLGKFVDGKFLKLTGRIKEQFKLENGKYVVPAPLEDTLTRSRYISQTFLYGDNRPYTMVLVVPDFMELKVWCDKKNIAYDDKNVESLLKHEVVVQLFEQELLHVCGLMKNFERPQKFAFITEPFSQENQMLTPKMSIRRNNVLKRYLPTIEEVYSGVKGYPINIKTDKYTLMQ